MRPENLQQRFEECQLLVKSEDFEQAARGLTDILRQAHHPVVANLLGFCLHRMGREDQAERVWIEALKDDPDNVSIACNLGNHFRERQRMVPARELLDRAYNLGTDNYRAAHNRAILAIDEGDNELALKLAEEAVALSKDDPSANHTLSLALLLCGNFERGLEMYDWRKQVYLRDTPPLPWYEGGPGKVIVRHEQGLGDTLMVARWLPKLAEQGAEVYLSCPKPLERIIEQSGLCALHKEGVEDYTHYFWTMDLLPRFAGKWEDISGEPYLTAELSDVMRWDDRLERGKWRIGICFAGATRPDKVAAYQIDRRRSLAPSEAAQIVRSRPDCAWVNLTREWGLPGCQDFGREVDDFADLAALISNLDLVITVDTALAHLAGGLGVDCIMLSRYDACWRWWPYTEKNTPLYRNMRCLYQPEPYDWQSVIERVIETI